MGTPSIHQLEAALGFPSPPPLDGEARALTVERVLPEHLTRESYELGDYEAIQSWSTTAMAAAYDGRRERVEVRLRTEDGPALEKRLRFLEDGSLSVRYRWDASAFPSSARFAPELTISMDLDLELEPSPSEMWHYDVRSFSKSERGPEESVQGFSVTPIWPCWLGEAALAIHRRAPTRRRRRQRAGDRSSRRR
jgi:hypothetical protein